MINRYLNETMTWEHVIATDEYSENTYETRTIKGRKEDGHKFIRDKYGVEQITTAVVFTESAIQTGDEIDGHLVISVDRNNFLNGTFAWNEAYLL